MKTWRLIGACIQAAVVGTALAIAVARLLMSSAGIAVFKYQGFEKARRRMIATALFWELLVVAWAGYWLLPARWRLLFFAGVSLAYLAAAGPAGALIPPAAHAAVLGGLAGLCFWIGPKTCARRGAEVRGDPPPWEPWAQRLAFWSLIGAILSYLFVSKYLLAYAFKSDDPAAAYVLPLGVSYVAFKLIHTVVEFGRGTIRDRGVGSYFASIFAFPTLAAGPIERYDHFLANRSTRLTSYDMLIGITRIILGLVKRFFVADQFFGVAWRTVTEGRLLRDLPTESGFTLWKLAFYCLLYMYLDFSAYSDIAIGCCRLFGLGIMENFNYPLIAPNLPAFWRRWHMTLTGWCQAYIFMPVLGLTRSPKVATFATFMVIGLWHGNARATWPWAMWGSYHGIGMIAHQNWNKLKRDRKWTWCDRRWWYVAGVAMTLAFVSAGDLVALAGPTKPIQAGELFLRLVFVGGVRHI